MREVPLAAARCYNYGSEVTPSWVRSESRVPDQGETVRSPVTVNPSRTPPSPPATESEPGVAQLISDLASAGLVSVEIDPGGDITFALTPQGQQAARLMSMSRHPHALVLLGALVGASNALN